MTVVDTIWRVDRKRSVSIVKRDDGYTFIEDGDVTGITYEQWPALVKGGIYDSPDTAEREARSLVPWLSLPNSN